MSEVDVVRLTQAQVLRLGRLLHMLYKPAEVAEELGVTADTVVRAYLPAGAPSVVGEDGKVWIVGTEFAAWARQVLATKRNRPRLVMAEGQGYCVGCNQVVSMISPERKRVRRGLDRLVGGCPACGRQVNRLVGGGQ